MVKADFVSSWRKQVKTDEWLHQRFDGCPLFLMDGIARAELAPEARKMKGGEGMLRIGFFTGGRTDWYLPLNELRQTADLIIRHAQSEDFGKNLMKKWERDEQLFDKKCCEYSSGELAEFPDDRLLNEFLSVFEIYRKRQTSSSLIDGFALTTDRLIYDSTLEFLKKRDGMYHPSRVFSILTAPVYISFSGEAEISICEILNFVAQDDDVRRLFQTQPVHKIHEILAENYQWILDLFAAHQSRYFWTKNNYITDYDLQIDDFLLEAKHRLIDGSSLRSGVERRVMKNKSDKNALILELHIPESLRILIAISECFTVWQDGRKKASMQATHCLGLFLREIAERTGYSVKELKFMMTDEIARLFSKKHFVSHEELDRRMKSCAVVMRRDRYQFITDHFTIQTLRDLTAPQKNFGDVRELNGLSVSLGKVIGRARLALSAKDSNRVQDGEILIAVMTRPDYFAGMKKAAAIVTDEGGVTSHAAIVSREFSIPCIVATRIATRVFRDGDWICVDADTGTVTKLDR